MDEWSILQFALSYPFARPEADYIHVNGNSFALSNFRSSRLMDWEIDVHGETKRAAEFFDSVDFKSLSIDDFLPIVAHGSNASFVQLRRKFGALSGDVIVPVIRVRIPNQMIVFANHITPYGSIPTTIEDRHGNDVDVFITFLLRREYDLMNKTEELGLYYDLTRLYDVQPLGNVDWQLNSVEAYRSCTGHLSHLPGETANSATHWPMVGQLEIQHFVKGLVANSVPIEQFIIENVTQPELRKERERALIEKTRQPDERLG